MLVSPNGTLYNMDFELTLDGDIDYDFNLTHHIGEVLPNGDIYSHYTEYCHVVIFYDGAPVFQNLIDVDWGCYYTDAKAEIHVLLDMQNETDSWFGFEIRNMSRDYDYVVNGTFTEDSNEIGNFNYGPIPNAGAGSTHTNWVSQFFPQPEKEYCIEAILTEKLIHDPFAPWENTRSTNYCVIFDGNQANENNTGNQENNTGNQENNTGNQENNTGNLPWLSGEIFADLTLTSLTNGSFKFNIGVDVSNLTVGEYYIAYIYSLFHATDSTCSESLNLGYGAFGGYLYGAGSDMTTSQNMAQHNFSNIFLVEEGMEDHRIDYLDHYYEYPYEMNYSINDSYYCLEVRLSHYYVPWEIYSIIDTDIDSIPFEATLDEPDPELSVEFLEVEASCDEVSASWGICNEGETGYLQRIDIQLDGAWYGYNHSISMKLADPEGIIIYSYFSPNDDIYENGGWHPVYLSDYDDLSMTFLTPLSRINQFGTDYITSIDGVTMGDLNDMPNYWKGSTAFGTLQGVREDCLFDLENPCDSESEIDGVTLEYPFLEAGEYCLEISIGYQKDFNDSSFTSFRNLFDKQTYCGIFEHDTGEGLILWNPVDGDEDETCDDLTDASCVELLCEKWEEQNPMLVDPRLENNGCPYELEIPEWWEEIPIIGDQVNNIVETVQTEFGRYIGAVVFGVTVLGYAYRAVTARSNFKKAKRMKKFERKIDKSNSKKDLDKVDTDVEKAEDKNLLPTGGYGDLKEMIETRMEELFGDGSSGGDEANESMSRGFGYEEANDMFNEMQSGMEAMRETQQEMTRMAESMRESQDSLFRQNLAPRAGAQRGGPKRPSQRPTPQVESLGKASGGPSRPSYHPKDLDEDGVVSEEDLQNWERLSEAEKRARLTGSVRGGGSLTSEIVAFSKDPGKFQSQMLLW